MATVEQPSRTLDVKGVNCPVPTLKTKQAFDELSQDEVLEVLATDPGSVSDLESWASSVDGAELLDQREVEEDGEPVYKHYVRKNGG